MLTTIAEADIQRSSVGAISVGQVAIGPIQIGRLVITDLEVTAAGDGAFLHNFRVAIDYEMSLEWRLHLDAPGVSIADSGVVDLGVSNFTVGFGDVKLPGLESFKLDIASLGLDNVAAASAPIGALTLGAAVAEQIQARNVTLPTQGFSIAGLGFGGLKIGNFGAPAASLDSVSIARLHGDAVPLGQMTLANLALPSASIGDKTADGVDLEAVPRPKAFHIDLGCMELTLKVIPKARAHIDQLVIRNISAGASIGKIELNNVVAPYEFLNLTLSQIGIETVSVPTVAIA